jgi:ferritin-like metal-binding protein YciE
MSAPEPKILQYLAEAHASEQALTRVLESQIAVAPRGSLRSALVTHLEETKGHASRVAERLDQLGQGSKPLLAAFGLAETVVGQMVAVGKTPLDLIRGSGGAEKVLKNAKDACATEGLEIATYTAIERLAQAAGDRTTAELASSIRQDEEKMLERLLQEIPKLTDALLDGSYSLSDTGAGEAVREAGSAVKKTARRSATTAKRNARTARKVPGVARAEGTAKGVVASEGDLPIARYDSLTVTDITAKLADLSQIDLAKIDVHERKQQGRSGVLDRISALQADEPWAGYDELTVPEIKAVLSEADEPRVKRIRAYEAGHKARTGVLEAADSERANA